jgi:nicotinate-nucleotide adenylyltransferase
MKLGIYGGTFNPPHIGHLITAESVREQFKLDKVIFVPSFSPPHKFDLQIALPNQRFEMLDLAIKSNRSFSATDLEIKREGKSYTIDTINSLLQSYQNSKLYLIIGMDNLIDFPNWKSPLEIVNKVELVVMNRPRYDLEARNEYTRYANIIRVPNIDISSTDIRRRVKMGRSIKYLVPNEVEQYIFKKGLYKS